MFLSLSRNSFHFVESEDSLPHKQVRASLIQSIQYISYILKVNLSIILPSMPGSSKWSLSLRFPHQNPQNVSPLICYIHRLSFLLNLFNKKEMVVTNWKYCYFKIWLHRQGHQSDSFCCVYLYWTDLFPCSFLTVILVLKSMIRVKK